MRKVTDLLIQLANRKMFALSVAVYLVFGAGVMPWGASTFSDLSGKKVEVVDLQITGYTFERAFEILNAYSAEARIFAAKFGLIADSLYPLAYTWLYLITFAWILKASRADSTTLRLAFIFPLLTMVVDFIENYHIGRLMYSFPEITEQSVATSSLFTQIKWGCFVAQTLVLFALLLQLIFYRRQNRTAALKG